MENVEQLVPSTESVDDIDTLIRELETDFQTQHAAILPVGFSIGSSNGCTNNCTDNCTHGCTYSSCSSPL